MNILSSREYLVDVMVKTFWIDHRQHQQQHQSQLGNYSSLNNNPLQATKNPQSISGRRSPKSPTSLSSSPMKPKNKATTPTLQSLTPIVQPLNRLSCQLHFGQEHFRFQQKPTLGSNGIADFHCQRITVPYNPDLALVFRKHPLNKPRQEIYIGHYQIEVDKFLEEGKMFFKDSQARLQEMNGLYCVDFECRIFDRMALVESETDELTGDDEDVDGKARDEKVAVGLVKRKSSNYSQMGGNNGRGSRGGSSPKAVMLLRKSQSEWNFGIDGRDDQNRRKRGSQKFSQQTEYPFLLRQQFQAKLNEVDTIIKKKQLTETCLKQLGNYSRDKHGNLKTKKLVQLSKVVDELKRDKLINEGLFMLFLAICGFFVGFMVA